MNNTITLSQLITRLAKATDVDNNTARRFLRIFFETIEKGLESDGEVFVKGFGTFRMAETSMSDGKKTPVFVPEDAFLEEINRPFEMFEPVELAEGVDFSEVDKASEPDEPAPAAAAVAEIIDSEHIEPEEEVGPEQVAPVEPVAEPHVVAESDESAENMSEESVVTEHSEFDEIVFEEPTESEESAITRQAKEETAEDKQLETQDIEPEDSSMTEFVEPDDIVIIDMDDEPAVIDESPALEIFEQDSDFEDADIEHEEVEKVVIPVKTIEIVPETPAHDIEQGKETVREVMMTEHLVEPVVHREEVKKESSVEAPKEASEEAPRAATVRREKIVEEPTETQQRVVGSYKMPSNIYDNYESVARSRGRIPVWAWAVVIVLIVCVIAYLVASWLTPVPTVEDYEDNEFAAETVTEAPQTVVEELGVEDLGSTTPEPDTEEPTEIVEVAQVPAAEAQPAKVEEAPKPAQQDAEAVYDVVEVSLIRLAKKHYGVGDYWVYIFEANRDKIKNPNRIMPGIKVLIPSESSLPGSTPEETKAIAKKKLSEYKF